MEPAVSPPARLGASNATPKTSHVYLRPGTGIFPHASKISGPRVLTLQDPNKGRMYLRSTHAEREQARDGFLHLCGTRLGIREAVFIHVVDLRQLQLHGLHAGFGLPVMTGDVAALEATVNHEAIARLAFEHVFELLLQCRRATRAFGRAQVEVRQL